MNIKNLKTTYDINAGCPPGRIVVSHDCDVNTRTVEVFFRQSVIPLAISQDCTAKAAFVERQSNILINDNVPCTVTERGSVLIPIDNLHRQGRFDMLIELTVTNQDGEQVLATPFPMWITVNGSILNEAEVTEESKGTVPELLESAEEALAHNKDYDALDNRPQINGHVLTGNQTAEDLGIESGGTDDYNDLNNLPEFVGFREPYYTDHVTIKDSISTPNFTFTQDENGHYTMSLSRVYGNTIVSNSAPFEIFNRATQEAIFKDYGYLSSPPFDFYTNYSSAPYENGIWHISGTDHLAGAPTALNHRLINFVNDGGRIQIVVTDAQLETLGEEKIFVRVQGGGNVGVWQELTGGGSEIVSGVVNQNGTITYYDGNGTALFTTSGDNLVTSGNQQISMGYDNGGFYFLFDDGGVTNGTN